MTSQIFKLLFYTDCVTLGSKERRQWYGATSNRPQRQFKSKISKYLHPNLQNLHLIPTSSSWRHQQNGVSVWWLFMTSLTLLLGLHVAAYGCDERTRRSCDAITQIRWLKWFLILKFDPHLLGADPNIRDFSGRFPIHYLKCITPPLLSKSRPNCSSAPKWCFHAFSGTPHTRARSDKLLLKLGEQTRAFSTNQRHAMSFAFPYGSAGRRRPSPDVTSRARLGSFAEPSTTHVDVGVKSPAGGSKVSRSESKLFSFMRRNSYRGGKSKSLHSDVTGKPKSIHSDVTAKSKSIHSDVTGKPKSIHSDVTAKSKSIHSDVTGKRLQQAEEIAKETPPPPSAAVIRATPASRFMWKPTTKP